MGAGAEDRTPLVAPEAPQSPPLQASPVPCCSPPGWAPLALGGAGRRGGSISGLQAGRQTPGASFLGGGQGRAEHGPGAPRSTCQGGKGGESGFAARDRRDKMERGVSVGPTTCSTAGAGWEVAARLETPGMEMAREGGRSEGEEKVAVGWCLVRVNGRGKCRGSLRCWGRPEVTVMEEGPSGRGAGQPRLLSTKGRSSGAVLSVSIAHILHASSCLRDGTLSLAGRVSLKRSGRKEAEAAGAEINTVLLSAGRLLQPHQALPGTPPPTKPTERCSWPLRARAAEAERGVEVQEVGSGGGEHPCSWELSGRQVGSSFWFSASSDTCVGQPALQQAEMLEKSWVC